MTTLFTLHTKRRNISGPLQSRPFVHLETHLLEWQLNTLTQHWLSGLSYHLLDPPPDTLNRSSAPVLLARSKTRTSLSAEQVTILISAVYGKNFMLNTLLVCPVASVRDVWKSSSWSESFGSCEDACGRQRHILASKQIKNLRGNSTRIACAHLQSSPELTNVVPSWLQHNAFIHPVWPYPLPSSSPSTCTRSMFLQRDGAEKEEYFHAQDRAYEGGLRRRVDNEVKRPDRLISLSEHSDRGGGEGLDSTVACIIGVLTVGDQFGGGGPRITSSDEHSRRL